MTSESTWLLSANETSARLDSGATRDPTESLCACAAFARVKSLGVATKCEKSRSRDFSLFVGGSEDCASLSLSYHRPLAMEVRNYCLPVESDLVATVAPVSFKLMVL